MYGNYDDNNNNDNNYNNYETNYDNNYGANYDNNSYDGSSSGDEPQEEGPQNIVSRIKNLMKSKRKYYGMTVPQLTVLGVMASCLFIIVGCGGWYAVTSTRAQAQAMQVAAVPPTVQPTVTPFVIEPTPTTVPTNTPTPIPYDQLIPKDWKQYKTSLIEIWMPTNFKLADKRTKDYTSNVGTSDLLLTEVSSKSSTFNMLVGVSYDVRTDPNLSLNDFLAAKPLSLQNQALVTSNQQVFINSHDARRLLIEFKVNNIDYNSLLYIIPDGSTIWYVEYVAEISEFFNNKDVFEQSVRTFRPASY